MSSVKPRVGKKSLCKGELFQKRADAWRERLGKKLKGMKQQRFADAMQERYCRLGSDAKCGQKNVSDWLHVGDAGQEKAFPPYEVMIQVAEELNVDVGYLTGETDGETFDAASAGEYLGLSVEAVEALHRLAMGPGSTFGYKYGPDPLAVRLLEEILTSDKLTDLLVDMRSFALIRDRIIRGKNAIERVSSRYSEQLLEKAQFVLHDRRLPPISSFPYETIEEYWDDNKEFLSEAGITYVTLRGVLMVAGQLDAAEDRLPEEDFDNDMIDTAYRYKLQSKFGHLLEEVFPPLQYA